MQEPITHPTGESHGEALLPVSGPVAVDTFAGRIHVDWNLDAARGGDAVGPVAVLHRLSACQWLV